jgi:hypothetical protein
MIQSGRGAPVSPRPQQAGRPAAGAGSDYPTGGRPAIERGRRAPLPSGPGAPTPLSPGRTWAARNAAARAGAARAAPSRPGRGFRVECTRGPGRPARPDARRLGCLPVSRITRPGAPVLEARPPRCPGLSGSARYGRRGGPTPAPIPDRGMTRMGRHPSQGVATGMWWLAMGQPRNGWTMRWLAGDAAGHGTTSAPGRRWAQPRGPRRREGFGGLPSHGLTAVTRTTAVARSRSAPGPPLPLEVVRLRVAGLGPCRRWARPAGRRAPYTRTSSSSSECRGVE